MAPPRKTHRYNTRSTKKLSKVASPPIARRNTKKDSRNPKRKPPPLRKAEADSNPSLDSLPTLAPSSSRSGITCQNEKTPKYQLRDLVGIDDIKSKILSRVIQPFVALEKARLASREPPRGILLVGPPGTGKTVLADAIVNEIKRLGRDVKYFHESGSCLSQFLGETEARIRSLFKRAHDEGPSVIFLDELDALGRKRSGSPSSDTFATILSTLLTQINETVRGHVLLIAATNHPDQVDQALIRKGRFDITYHLPLPNLAGRRAIIEHYLGKKKHELNAKTLDNVAKVTENFAGSELEALANEIHDCVFERVFPGDGWIKMPQKQFKAQCVKLKKVEESDIIKALQDTVKGFDAEQFKNVKNTRKRK